MSPQVVGTRLRRGNLDEEVADHLASGNSRRIARVVRGSVPMNAGMLRGLLFSNATTTPASSWTPKAGCAGQKLHRRDLLADALRGDMGLRRRPRWIRIAAPQPSGEAESFDHHLTTPVT
jgi:hypothetical protein